MRVFALDQRFGGVVLQVFLTLRLVPVHRADDVGKRTVPIVHGAFVIDVYKRQERPRLKGDLWLERGANRYRLEFDCVRCEMSLVDCTRKETAKPKP